MKSQTSFLNPSRLWAALFVIWFIILTGVLTPFTGTPGLIHIVRLRSLMEHRKGQLSTIQNEKGRLLTEASLLNRSQHAQEREIRKTLGYIRDDEILFDFSK